MMADRRLQALCLVLVMLSSSVAAPASAQTADPKQPSVDNPNMYFWGTSQMDQCWTHFDGEGNDGSSQDGYGEKEFTGNGEQIDIDFTCRIQSGETFKENMYLSSNSSIVIELEFQIQHTDCDEQRECQDLTLTLFKGTVYYPTYQPPPGNQRCSVGHAFICGRVMECGQNISERLALETPEGVINPDTNNCAYVREGVLSELVMFSDKLYANVAGPSDDEDTLFSILSIPGDIISNKGGWRDSSF